MAVDHVTIGPLSPRFDRKVANYVIHRGDSFSMSQQDKEGLRDFFRQIQVGPVRVPCTKIGSIMIVSVNGFLITFTHNGQRVSKIERGVVE